MYNPNAMVRGDGSFTEGMLLSFLSKSLFCKSQLSLESLHSILESSPESRQTSPSHVKSPQFLSSILKQVNSALCPN